MTKNELLEELRAIRAVLTPLPDDPDRHCIGCRPVTTALLLLDALARKVESAAVVRGAGGGAILFLLFALAVVALSANVVLTR